jgi:alkanesulfonate monooxygenase SsuD/methylene tetrahydromethanopterin reductase-like flavin-dependent oxidoreductase (luciferase family)
MASPMLTVVRASFLELFLLETNKRGYIGMTTELNELMNVADDEKAQIWIIGTRDQVIHQINEFYVKRIATDRIKFTPIIPAPFAKGKYMTVLVR